MLLIGRRVRQLRKERGLTQERFAEQMGISPGYLRRVELGRENLTVESIGKLASALEARIGDLISG